MIKVEKGMCEIKAVNGVPDIMTDLACIIRSIRTTMVEKRDYSETETKELVEQAVNAALLGEALNLSPSPQLGQFYMVPFDNKKKGCKEAQFQLGYKGCCLCCSRGLLQIQCAATVRNPVGEVRK